MKNKILKLMVPLLVALTGSGFAQSSIIKLDTTKILTIGTFKPTYVTINNVHTFSKLTLYVTSKDGSKYPITGFSMTYVAKGKDLKAFSNIGNTFTPEMKQALNYANEGDMIYFDNIKFYDNKKHLTRAKSASFQVISETPDE